jgi:hypothetical protein
MFSWMRSTMCALLGFLRFPFPVQQRVVGQFEIQPALTSISCATSVSERFSLDTVKFSNRARSRNDVQSRDASNIFAALPLIRAS